MTNLNHGSLGVDVGGVVTDGKFRGTGTWLAKGADYLNTPFAEGVIEALAFLTQPRWFGDRVYLLSKCDPETEQITMEFLHHRRFFDRTGINPRNTFFCRGHADKAPIAHARKTTVFVDDRYAVLRHMTQVRLRLAYRPDPAEAARFGCVPGITPVHSWAAIVRLFAAQA